LLQPGWNARADPGLISALLSQRAAQNEGSPSNPEGEEELVAPISENPAGAASSPPEATAADESPQSSEEKIVFQVSYAASFS